MPTQRQADLLHLLVDHYIETASPVSSTGLVRQHRLSISSATVRNELAELEEAGLVFRAHTSAGVIPTEQGYRYYVESLAGRLELSAAQQRTIRHQFHQVEMDEDRWVRLAAATLAQRVVALAIVTPVRALVGRLRVLEIVQVSETRAILVQILEGGRVQRMLVQLTDNVDWPAFERAAHRLTEAYSGRTRVEIANALSKTENSIDRQILEASLNLMEQAARDTSDESFVYGFTQVLNQPEFLGDTELVRDLIEAVEGGRLIPALRPEDVPQGELRVVIGHEHTESFLHPYGVVVGTYGSPFGGKGTIAVLGPTRMAYAMAIPSVRYMTNLLSEMVTDLR
jgi:heat-inducible transcriptional repressor